MTQSGKGENSGVTEADYASFCRVDDKGRIRWRLEDAYKLGAGYVPTADDDRSIEPVLVAPSNRVRANERDLLAAFHQEHSEIDAPRLQRQEEEGCADDVKFVEGEYFVDAVEFLDWLSQYIARSQSGIPFPTELIRAVRDAMASAHARHDETRQCDGPTDPQAEAERARAWDLWCELDDVRKKIDEYQRRQPTSITEIALRDDHIKELEVRQGEIEQALGGENHGSPWKTPRGNTTRRSLRDLDYGPERDRRIVERLKELEHDGKAAPLKRLADEVGVHASAIKQARARHAKRQMPVQASNLLGQLKAANPRGRG